MRGFRAMAFSLGIGAGIVGALQSVLAGAGVLPIDAVDLVPPSALVGGTGALGSGSTIRIDYLSGDEIRMPSQDTRGHARSFNSPRREAKGTKKFV